MRRSALAALILGLSFVAASAVPVARGQASPSTQSAPAGAKPVAQPFRNQPSRLAYRARIYYETLWGVDDLKAKVVESGEMVRFTYRVVDPEKAKPLNDKKVEPSLICPEKGVRLVIPSLEKVGQLRQSVNAPEAGKSYWMAFSNKGGIVKRGDRVNIVIGNFHADAIEVE